MLEQLQEMLEERQEMLGVAQIHRLFQQVPQIYLYIGQHYWRAKKVIEKGRRCVKTKQNPNEWT
jgi:hypothetical protein